MLGTDIFGPGVEQAPAATALSVLLYAFCILFAINSAIHSYLIVRYAEGNKVAMQVGVYYASNALGRLVGTLASGALFTYAGSTVVDRFGVCLFCSVAFSTISSVVDKFLTEDQPGASWLSPFNRCLPQRMLKVESDAVVIKNDSGAQEDTLEGALEDVLEGVQESNTKTHAISR